MKQTIFFLFLCCLCLFSCEKIDVNELGKNDNGKVKVTFNIAGVEQIPFENTTATRTGEKLFSRFTVALFNGDTKVKNVNQTADDSQFGNVSIEIEPGTYQLVAIAHNGLGSCTVSSPDKITFANNKMTDTFYYYGTVEIKESGSNPLVLKRAVSMFRLITTDPIPENVAQMKFYYTGGSSTFNAISGFGCVNSKQTEILTVTNPSADTHTFEIYSFPHNTTGNLTIKVTAMDIAGNTITEKTYDNVPIQQNVITQYTTQFFTDIPGAVNTFSTTATVENNGEWQKTIDM